MNSDLTVREPDLVVAGQTAPSPGILLTNGGITIAAGDVTIEHLAIRPGDDSNGTSASVRRSISVRGASARNVRLEHLSLSWGVESNVSTTGKVSDVTLSDSIIAESLHSSIYPRGPRGYGVVVGQNGRRVRFVRNLLAANYDANVRWKYDTSGEMINNVVYGWGGRSSWNTTNISNLESKSAPTLLDVIGNIYVPGPNGRKSAYAVYSQQTPNKSRVFIDDLVAPAFSNVKRRYLASGRLLEGPEPISSASVFGAVTANAGSRPWDRNADDLRIIDGVKSATLPIRDEIDSWPEYQVNRREIPLNSDSMTEAELDVALAEFEQ